MSSTIKGTRSPRSSVPNCMERHNSQRDSQRENRRKLLESMDGSSIRLLRESGNRKVSRSSATRSSRRTRSSRHRDMESRENKRRGPRRCQTTEGEIPTQSRSSRTKRASSSPNKDPLDGLPKNEEGNNNDQRDSTTLEHLTKGIQLASSMHYSHRDISKRRMHNSFSVRESSSSRLSTSSRHSNHGLSGFSRHGRSVRSHCRRDGSCRRSEQQQTKDDALVEDESIQVLQFDCSQSSGLSFVDANNVHSKNSRNSCVEQMTVLLPEDLSDAVTEGTTSLESSFNSSVHTAAEFAGEEDQPLIFSKDAEKQAYEHYRQEQVTKNRSKKSIYAFKAVSKLLATPLVRRKSPVNQTHDLMDMSMTSLDTLSMKE